MDSGGTNRFRSGDAQIRPEGRRLFTAAPLCRIIAKEADTRYAYISKKPRLQRKELLEDMLTNEIVLKVFADYLSRDTDYEVILTSRGYTVMGWDNYREDWNTVEYCPTPAALREALLDAYTSFRETELTDGECDLTADEKAKVQAECDALTEQCEKEAEICSS